MSSIDNYPLIEGCELVDLGALTGIPLVNRVALPEIDRSPYVRAARPAYVSSALANSGLTLLEVLEWGSSALSEAASAIGARLIDHEWGLIDNRDPRFSHKEERLPSNYQLGDNFVLGAVVDIIKEQTPLSIDQVKAIVDLSRDTPIQDGLHWSDCYFGQFVNGTNSKGEQSLWLVDVDLKFSDFLATQPR